MHYREKAYAKLNLSFRVLKKLPNGYHSIQSLIVFIPNLHDTLLVKLSDSNNIKIGGKFAKNLLACGGDKLVYKTIKEFSNYFSRSIKLDVLLTKEIPLGAGLGGGSADASAIARVILKIFKIKCEKKEIIKLLMKIGADLPVCFYSSNLLVEGMGNRIIPFKKLNFKPWILIITPPINISTKLIFENFVGPFSKKKSDYYTVSKLLFDLNNFSNPLEDIVKKKFFSFAKLINSLPKLNSICSPRMTGSGSSIFILFNTENDAKKYLKEINYLIKNCWAKISQLSL